MKTQNTKQLEFKRKAIVTLSNEDLMTVRGGTLTVIGPTILFTTLHTK